MRKYLFIQSLSIIFTVLNPLWIRNPLTGTLTNRVDPDEMLHYAAFHHGLSHNAAFHHGRAHNAAFHHGLSHNAAFLHGLHCLL